MDFDLGKLTLVGWLVLLVTAGIILTGAFMVALASNAAPGAEDVVKDRGSRKIVAWILIGGAAAFFLGCKLLLGKVGLPMFRS